MFLVAVGTEIVSSTRVTSLCMLHILLGVCAGVSHSFVFVVVCCTADTRSVLPEVMTLLWRGKRCLVVFLLNF